MISARPWSIQDEGQWNRLGIPLKASWLADKCWVCEEGISALSTTRKRNDHHVIPEAYGGVDGPQVSLCSAHHSLLHDVATAFIAGKASPALVTLNRLPPLQRLRVLWLASRVYLSHQAISGDQNRRLKVVLHVTALDLERIDQARRRLNQSREEFIRNAIKHYVRTQFPLK